MKLLLAVGLAVVLFAAVRVAADRRKLKGKISALGLEGPDVRAIRCEGLMLRFVLKPAEGIVYAITGVEAAPVSVPLAEIGGCEFLDYGERKQSLGRALAGEAAADRLSGARPLAVLRILRKDPDDPPVEYRLTKAAYHEDFRIFAQEVQELLAEFSK